MSEPSPPARHLAARRAGRLAALGFVCLVAGLALGIHDLSGANRPHELRWGWAVATLLLGNAVACVFVALALRSVRVLRSDGALPGWRRLQVALSSGYVVLNLALIAGVVLARFLA